MPCGSAWADPTATRPFRATPRLPDPTGDRSPVHSYEGSDDRPAPTLRRLIAPPRRPERDSERRQALVPVAPPIYNDRDRFTSLGRGDEKGSRCESAETLLCSARAGALSATSTRFREGRPELVTSRKPEDLPVHTCFGASRPRRPDCRIKIVPSDDTPVRPFALVRRHHFCPARREEASRASH